MSEATPKPRRTNKGKKLGPHRKADDSVMQEVVRGIPLAVRRWLQRVKTMGLSQRQVIWELHVRQGKPLLEIASILKISLEGVCNHWRHIRESIAENAPKTEADYIAVREELHAVLRQTIEETYQKAKIIENGKEIELSMPTCPKMLAIRLKAVDQIARLYGVNQEVQAVGTGTLPYATPAEIMDAVRQRVLALHGKPVTLLEQREGDT